MPLPPSDPIYIKALKAGQEHIFSQWDRLSADEQTALYRQASRLDFDWFECAVHEFQTSDPNADFNAFEPANVASLSSQDSHQARQLGEEIIRRGEVAVLVLAGGQGTRLGYLSPKGMYPVGPVSGKSLFEWFAEKIHFYNNYYKTRVPWLVMTSPATDRDTRSFFQQSGHFGLESENIYFFSQGTLPAFNRQGKIVLDAPGHILESPDGHGGVVTALSENGILEEMERRGVKHVFVHNVDNCLVKLLDPTFIGWHMNEGLDFSLKCLEKSTPQETLGTAVRTLDKTGKAQLRIVEYSETPLEVARLRDAKGRLVYGIGSINIYLLRVAFLKRLIQDACKLPYHYTVRSTLAIGGDGSLNHPIEPNTVKLESKLFDALLYTDRAGIWLADRSEFSPLKGVQGPESADSVAADMLAQFKHWLNATDIVLPTGKVRTIEISPLFAVDCETFQERAAVYGHDALQREVDLQIAETGQIRL